MGKSIMIGLVAIAFIVGSSSIGYSVAEPNGTPFLQEEIDAIIDIIQDLQDQLDNLHVTWINISDKPQGFADDIDNDILMEISTSCTTDQVAKWDGTQWVCADTASGIIGGEVALRKVDCNIILEKLNRPIQFQTVDGCNLDGYNFDNMDLSTANLSLVNLRYSAFDEANLSYVDFSGGILTEVDFFGSNLSGADFTGADITDANFQSTFADPPCIGIAICDTLPTS